MTLKHCYSHVMNVIALGNVPKCPIVTMYLICQAHAIYNDGNGIDSACATLLSICLAIVDLFVFFRV